MLPSYSWLYSVGKDEPILSVPHTMVCGGAIKLTSQSLSYGKWFLDFTLDPKQEFLDNKLSFDFRNVTGQSDVSTVNILPSLLDESLTQSFTARFMTESFQERGWDFIAHMGLPYKKDSFCQLNFFREGSQFSPLTISESSLGFSVDIKAGLNVNFNSISKLGDAVGDYDAVNKRTLVKALNQVRFTSDFTSDVIKFANSNLPNQPYISYIGNDGALAVSSSRRLKHSIRRFHPRGGYLDRLENINLYRYGLLNPSSESDDLATKEKKFLKSTEQHLGLLSEEVAEFLPECVDDLDFISYNLLDIPVHLDKKSLTKARRSYVEAYNKKRGNIKSIKTYNLLCFLIGCVKELQDKFNLIK